MFMKRKMFLLSVICFLMTMCFTNIVKAIVEDTGWIEWKQPNGVTFIGRSWGIDEFEGYMETQSGYRFVQGIDGYYYYAILDTNGEYTASANKIGIDAPKTESLHLERSASRMAQIQAMRDAFNEQIEQNALEFAQRQAVAKAEGRAEVYKVGVLLVEFSDTLHFTNPLIDRPNGYWISDFEKMLFDSLGGWYHDDPLHPENSPHPEKDRVFGSMRDYYYQQSIPNGVPGSLNVIGHVINPPVDPLVAHPVPQWLQLDSSKQSYHNKSIGTAGSWGYLVNESINKAISLNWIPNLMQFDHIIIIYAGQIYYSGNPAGQGLNPHYSYGTHIMGEKSTRSSKPFAHMGIHAHEFGHRLGFPDNSESKEFGLMGSGVWNGSDYWRSQNCPSGIEPKYRMQFNWITPDTLYANITDMILNYNYSNPRYLVIKNNYTGADYFLVENRGRYGFDRFTPTTEDNFINQGGTFLIWYNGDQIIPANGTGDPLKSTFFPEYGTVSQNISDDTYPNTILNNGNLSHIAIQDISWNSIDTTTQFNVDLFHGVESITENVTWNSLKVIDKDVVITNNGRLKINQGTIVSVGSNAPEKYRIIVEPGGILEAEGTSSNPIIFKSGDELLNNENWEGIELKNGAILKFHNVIIKNAQIGLSFNGASINNFNNICIKSCQTGVSVNIGNDLQLNNITIDSCYNGMILDGNNSSISNFIFKNNIIDNVKINGNLNLIELSEFHGRSSCLRMYGKGCHVDNSLFYSSNIYIADSTNQILNSSFFDSSIISVGNGQVINNLIFNSYITISGNSRALIKNNLLISNKHTNSGIQIEPSRFQNQISIPVIKNNVIIGYYFGINSYRNYGEANPPIPPEPIIKNNIIFLNNVTAEGNGSLQGNGLATFNCIYNLDTAGFPYGNGNFYGDPLFRDTLTGDYRLAYNSPCIDSGDPNDLFTYEPEPNGGRINMGHHGNTAEATGTFDLVVTENLQDDAEWDGQIMIANDVSTNGYDLTVNAGARLYFENGKSLTADGVFSSVGSYEHPVIYRAWRETDRMNGVILTGGAAADIRYSEFRYANTALTFDEYIQSGNKDFLNLTFDHNGTGAYLNKAGAIFRNSYFRDNGTGMLCQKSSLTLSGSVLNDNSEEGLYLFDEPVFEISGCQFNGNGKRGVYFHTASDGRFDSNTVYGNGALSIAEPNLKGGLVFYQSSPMMNRNQVAENLAPGILSMSSSIPVMIKSANNLIANNRESLQQNDPDILAKDISIPEIEGGHNDILDDEGGYLIHAGEDTREITIDVSENYWGTTDENEILSRLYRQNGFEIRPFDEYANWEGGRSGEALLMFSRAAELESGSDYTTAFQTYDSIVSQYSVFHIAKAALQRSRLCRVKSGQNANQVRSYLAPLLNHADEQIVKIAKRLTYRTYTNESDYDQAIQFHDHWRNTTGNANDSIYSSVDILTNELLRSGGRIAKNSGVSGLFRKTNQLKQYKKESDRILAGAFARNTNNPDNGVPKTFELSQNYPNPFNPATTIRYQLPLASKVTVKIYNILGQEVATLINKPQAAGYYSLNWNGKSDKSRQVTSGVYIYRIVAKSDDKTFVKSKKMMLIK